MAEVIVGKASGDRLNARNDKTQIYGLSGNDTLTSENKSEVLLVGGSGNDRLIMKGGNGTLNGGAGQDTFEFNYSADQKVSAVIEDIDPQNDKIIVNFGGDSAPQLSRTISGNDVVVTDSTGSFSLTLKGIRENDYYDGTASDEIWSVLELTNKEREENGLSPLTLSDGLMQGASIRAEEITAKGASGALSDHTRLDGKTGWLTVFDEIDVYYENSGENLDGGARSPESVVEDWMNSPNHRANILNGNFKKLGVGYNYYDADPNDLRYYWTQWFADSLTTAETVSTENLLQTDIEGNAVSLFVSLSDNPETYSNTLDGATVQALGGNDSITNDKLLVSISGDAGNDTVSNSDAFVTINGGAGDDSVNLSSNAIGNVVEYAGDGNDSVTGFNADDTLKISGGEYTPATVGNDVFVAVGDDSIKLVNAASLGSVNIDGTWSKVAILTEGNDNFQSTVTGSTITALGGDDTIDNRGENVSIDGGAGNDSIDNGSGIGNDSIENGGASSVVNGGPGNDYISNNAVNVTINGNEDDDYLENIASFVTMSGGDGDDFLYIEDSHYVSAIGGIGNDTVFAYEASNLTIDAGSGNDSILNYSSNVIIEVGEGNDSVHNSSVNRNDSSNVTINGGNGDNLISNAFNDSVSIATGDGNDTILNNGENVKIVSGAGNDSIINNNGSGSTDINGGSQVTIESGDGDDYISSGVNSDSVSIDSGAGDDSIITAGNSISIDSGAGNDEIHQRGSNTTINAGRDNDIINFADGSQNNLVQYAAGDGRDTIFGFKANDTLRIGDGTGTYSTTTGIRNVVVNVGKGSITIVNAAGLSTLNIEGTEQDAVSSDDLVILTGENDTYNNTVEGATITAGGGSDIITNTGDNVLIYLGNDNDTVENSGNNVNINAGAGNDSISNAGSNAIINSGLGDDEINLLDDANHTFIKYTTGDGNDSIVGFKATDTLTISGNCRRATVGNDIVLTVGNDSITIVNATNLSRLNIIDDSGSTETEEKLVELTESDDKYDNNVEGATILALGGNDCIGNYQSDVLIDGGADNDSLDNDGARVSISGDTGEDYIRNSGNDVSINAGLDNDYIYNEGDNATFIYAAGDGNDYIDGFKSNSTLSITGGNYTSVTSDDDVILTVGSGKITLAGAANLETLNIKGTYGSSESVSGLNITNTTDSTVVTGTAYADTIDNFGTNVSISSSAGDDSILNWGADTTIDGGTGNDSIYYHGSDTGTETNVSILGGADDDTIYNRSGDVLTINGGTGNDVITNWEGYTVTIFGGAGNDTIINDSCQNVTVLGGAGNDLISLTSSALNNFIQYTAGSGNDTIVGFKSNDTLNVLSDYTRSTVGNDLVVVVGTASIKLVDAASISPVNITSILNDISDEVPIVELTEGDDKYDNTVNGVKILGLGGNDSINNYGKNVTVEGGTGNDVIGISGIGNFVDGGDGNDNIVNTGTLISIDSGAGKDTVWNYGANVTVNGGADDDYVNNDEVNVLIDSGAGNDSIENFGASSTLNGGDDNDYISNYSGAVSTSINGGAGNDSIENFAASVTIDGGTEADLIVNSSVGGANVSINGGNGNDSISNTAENVTINGDEDDDRIINEGSNVSIIGGTGDDRISLSADSQNSFIKYTTGDGNDSIWGLKEGDSLQIDGKYSTVGTPSGDDIIVKVGNGKITLKNFRGNPKHVIIGASGSSGGSSGNASTGTGGTSGGDGSSGNASTGTGGTSGSGNNSASTGTSTSGSGGNTGGGSGGNTGGGSGGNTGGSSGGGSSNSTLRNLRNYFYNNSTTVINNSQSRTISYADNSSAENSQNSYSGGNQVISNYQSTNPILFNAAYVDSFFDNANNFYVASTTGTLVLQKVGGKLLDICNSAGNDFVKAYAATTSGLIDGRGIDGFEVIKGSTGVDEIYAGDGGSQLFGGDDNVSDTLIGGSGIDNFFVGKTQGSDFIRNASSADTVNLIDTRFSDLTSVEENNDTISLTFNTGKVIKVQSSEALSAEFAFDDGSAYRYDHATGSWQTISGAENSMDAKYVYTGGDQIISEYQSGDKVLFSAEYTGVHYDGAGNFFATSASGSFAIQNALGKVIDVRDGAGNDFVKAYAAIESGVINGKEISGYEYIDGSTGADEIYAGDDGSKLWGGSGDVSDILVGGAGQDVFVAGRTQGSDLILNASSADIVHLNDATLSDIISLDETNDMISLTFNTGSVVNVQSSEAESARFLLADGSSYRYNHSTGSWQTN